MMNKYIYLILLIIIIIFLKNKENFTSIKKDNEILNLEKDLIKYNNIDTKDLQMDMRKTINQQVRKNFKINLNSIRKLSYITEAMNKNGLLIPGNVKILGNMIADQSPINKIVNKLKKEVSELKKREKIQNNRINSEISRNINAYYFFKRFPSQIKNPPSISILREPRDGSSFYFGMEKKYGGATFNYIENYRDMNLYYPGKPGERLYGLNIHGYRTEGTCPNSSTPRKDFNWTNAIDNNWNHWFISYRGTIYGPFQPRDIKFCPGQSTVNKFLDFNRNLWN